mmetsp:Transcript_22664/g.65305  ORF Transcript_22664/g.65305 Transcript_22664/m.65305 type:complete len:241 (+) Transcript_22664:134-856(+)
MSWKYWLKSSKLTGVSPSWLKASKIFVAFLEMPRPRPSPLMRPLTSSRDSTPSPSLSRRLKVARRCRRRRPRLEGSTAATKRENSTRPSRAKCPAARSASSRPRPAASMALASSPVSSMPFLARSMEPKVAARPRSSQSGICDATSSSTASSSALMLSKFRRQSSFAMDSTLTECSSRSHACASTWTIDGRRRSSQVSIRRRRLWASGPPRKLSNGGPSSWRAAYASRSSSLVPSGGAKG